MHLIKELKQKIYAGNDISKEEALALADASTDLQELAAAADEIRKHLCGNRFDLCTIVNGKCGGARRTANTVPRAPTTRRTAMTAIRSCRHRPCLRAHRAAKNRACCAIRS